MPPGHPPEEEQSFVNKAPQSASKTPMKPPLVSTERRLAMLLARVVVTMVVATTAPFAARAGSIGIDLPPPVHLKTTTPVCPTTRPSMPRDSDMPPMYTPGDKSFSTRDVATQAEFDAKRRPFDVARQAVDRLVEDYFGAHAVRPAGALEVRACLVDLLDAWAMDGALLGTMSHQAGDYRKFVAPSVAIGFFVASNGNDALSDERRRRIARWLGEVNDRGRAQMDEWARSRNLINNHHYWVAYVALLVGMTTDDESRIAWGEKYLRHGLAAIDGDGLLKEELTRKSRSLFYHAYALAPLAMSTYMMKKRGLEVSDGELAALHRLARLVVAGYADPTSFTTRPAVVAAGAGVDQQGLDSLDKMSAAFDPLVRLFPDDPDLRAAHAKFPNRVASNLGPAMSALFSRTRR